MEIPYHLPTGTKTPLSRIPSRNLPRQCPRRRRIYRHIPRPQLRFCERLIEVIKIALTQQQVIEEDGLVDESCECLLCVEGCGCGGEGEVEGFGFDFRAGDGVGDYDLLDAGGEVVGV